MRTRSGIPLQEFYVAPDEPGEHPGTFPFTRGRASSPHVRRRWIQRELSGEGDARQSNAQIRYLIEHGQTGVDVIGDSPTQAMMDPDHPLAREAVGTQGVSLCCKQDFIDLYRDLPFDQISVSSSVPAIIALSGLILSARDAGFQIDKLRGSVLQPPLYAEDCGYAIHLPVEFRVRMSLDTMEYCAKEMPRFHSFLEDTYFFSEAGLTPVEEMALGFVEIRHLTRRLMDRGVPVDAFAPRIAILVNCGMDFFEEIAKVRASRRLFANMMRGEFGAQDARSLSVVITSHTSGLSLTAQQPVNNIVRGTLQALSLVLGGVQAIEISAFDEAFRTPSREAHRVALRTQQIIDLESGVGRVADPLGGAFFVESLTDEIEARIRARIDEIESTDDPEALSRNGYFRQIFEDAMVESHRKIEIGEVQIVGLNVQRIPASEDRLMRDLAEEKIQPGADQIDRIVDFKQSRDFAAAKRGLRAVRSAVQSGENLVPVVTGALDLGATVGEIAGMMRVGLGCPYDPHGLLEPPVV